MSDRGGESELTLTIYDEEGDELKKVTYLDEENKEGQEVDEGRTFEYCKAKKA